MKKVKVLFLILLLAGSSRNICAQSATGLDQLRSVLKKTFDDFDTAKAPEERVRLSGRLGLIAAKWNNEWITHYYVAYSKVVLSQDKKLEADKRDALLDEAAGELTKAVGLLGKENDETHVLSAFIANWRIAVSPMSRYMVYGKEFTAHINAAIAINPGNPRTYYLRGMAWFGMPKFAGGGKEVAEPFLSKADSLYAKETDADITKPYWGKKDAADHLAQCKSKD